MSKALLGVREIFPLVKGGDDRVVVGRLQGTVSVGDAVFLKNIDEETDMPFMSTVKRIEMKPNESVNEATDCMAALFLENAAEFNLKSGTVVHSYDSEPDEIRNAYINTMGDYYVSQKKLELKDEELERLTINDLTEIWRLFVWIAPKLEGDMEEKKKEYKPRLDKIGATVCRKLLEADEIYCVYNKNTGEPHMFSKTVNQGNDSYMCMPPHILVATKSQSELLARTLSPEVYEFKKIEKGEDGKGIYNFFGSTFYLNGACSVAVNCEQANIGAQMLVPKPDYSNTPKQNVPVTNPDLVRWLLLIGQLGKPETDDAELIYKLYYRFMALELRKAKLLVPMQHDGEMPSADENGKAVLKKDVQLKIATQKGKTEKDAVRMYTDWKRLHMVYDDSWNGMVQTVEAMIDPFDCAINVTEFPAAGCYVSGDMFENMKKFK